MVSRKLVRMCLLLGTQRYTRFPRFTGIDHLLQEDLHQRLVDFHLLIPTTSKHAFLYSGNIIVCFSSK